MKRNKNLRQSLKKFSNAKENTQEILFGELGIPLNGTKTVEVASRPGYVYVRLRGNKSELIQAYNTTVPAIYDYPVQVLRERNTYTILGKDQSKWSNLGNIGNTGGTTPLPKHGGQHSFNPNAGMGADTTWIYSRQFMSQLAYPSGTSMQLSLNPSFYEWNGQFKYINPTGSVSFAPYVPVGTGSRFALLWIEGNTGNLRISAGAGFSGGISNLWELAPYIPDIDRNNGIPLMAVRLNTGTSSLTWSNLYDVRDFYTVQKEFRGIGIQDDGAAKGTGTILNFGNNLSVTVSNGIATIDAVAGGGGGGGIGVVGQDEGVYVATGTTLNVTGQRANLTASGTVLNLNISPDPQELIGAMIWDEGVPKGTGTILNFVGNNIDASLSGSVVRIFVTGSTGGGANPPVTGSLVFWDEGVLKGSATILDVVGNNVDLTISGSVARLFVTGSVSAQSGTGTATYFRVGQPTPLAAHTTGTYWKVPDGQYATGSLAIFNQGHALIIGTDYTEQYPASGTYQYAQAQETGTYHLALYGVPATVAGSQSTGSASGRTLIAEVTPSGTTSVTVASSIAGTYKKLIIEFAIRGTNASDSVDGYLYFNNDTTATNYDYRSWRLNTFGGTNEGGNANIFGRNHLPAANTSANFFGIGVIEIPQYANTNFYKGAVFRIMAMANVNDQYQDGGVDWRSTSAITRIDIALSAGNFANGSVISLYGEN